MSRPQVDITSSVFQCVKLKYLAAELNDNEFDAIFSKMRKNFGRPYLLQLFIASFASTMLPSVQGRAAGDYHAIKKAILTISSIILQRDHNNRKSMASSNKEDGQKLLDFCS